VPKIAAPTVLENRELRRHALFTAATTIIERTGSAQFSVAQVAQEVGLSRSAVYEYYASAAETGNWTQSWEQWANGGKGGPVCRRVLWFDSNNNWWRSAGR